MIIAVSTYLAKNTKHENDFIINDANEQKDEEEENQCWKLMEYINP